MTKLELIHSLTDLLVNLGGVLSRDDIQDDPAKYQQLVALDKHLNDQQLSLIHAQLKEDNADFLIYTGLIEKSTQQLNTEIAQQRQIDAIINTVAQISGYVDSVLKLL